LTNGRICDIIINVKRGRDLQHLKLSLTSGRNSELHSVSTHKNFSKIFENPLDKSIKV
jgi:hypothetical protein